MIPTKVPDMRRLAACLRVQAAETSLALYKRKFEGLASELEEEALESESRDAFLKSFRLVS
ncbi:MAG: hypothetical protein JWP16_770 [Alphaproteobacteria bacterium]|nr:hypothetical protein [Alphaproteobacteria bacterium]